MSAVAAAAVAGETGQVAKATQFPGWCVICRSATGPFWDSGNDLKDLHLYVCRLCLNRANLGMGYAKGEEMERLNKAADRLVDAEKERDEAQDAAHKMADALTRIQQEKLGLTTELERLRGQNDQLVFKAQQVAASANEMIVGSSD